MSRMDAVARYAQEHDFTAEIEHGGVCEDDPDPDPDPMVTTSVRLPTSLLDWVRARAAAEHVRPSALIRQWLEQRREAEPGTDAADLAARVARLEGAVFSGKRAF